MNNSHDIEFKLQDRSQNNSAWRRKHSSTKVNMEQSCIFLLQEEMFISCEK